MNAARHFMCREDYQPPKTHPDSPFHRFNVSCLKCGSVKLRLIGEFNPEIGDPTVFLFCPSCRERGGNFGRPCPKLRPLLFLQRF